MSLSQKTSPCKAPATPGAESERLCGALGQIRPGGVSRAVHPLWGAFPGACPLSIRAPLSSRAPTPREGPCDPHACGPLHRARWPCVLSATPGRIAQILPARCSLKAVSRSRGYARRQGVRGDGTIIIATIPDFQKVVTSLRESNLGGRVPPLCQRGEPLADDLFVGIPHAYDQVEVGRDIRKGHHELPGARY